MEEWIKTIAYIVLTKVSEHDWSYLDQPNVMSRPTRLQLEEQFKLYPSNIGSPPLSSMEEFTGDKLDDKTGWWIDCPFYDNAGNKTDLELRLWIHGNSNNCRITILDVLVP